MKRTTTSERRTSTTMTTTTTTTTTKGVVAVEAKRSMTSGSKESDSLQVAKLQGSSFFWSDAWSTARQHWKEGKVNKHMVVRFLLLHSFALEGVRRIPRCANETLLWAFVLYFASMLGITVGAHRLWSHRSFEASFVARVFLMLCNSVANQGSIYHWSRDHRVHHKYSETDADPHNASRGFFFAHVGWLFLHKSPEVVEAGRQLDLSDLLDDPVVRFQRSCEPWLSLAACFVMPVVVAHCFWGEDLANAFFVAAGTRYCLNLHFTFLVNSAAHLWGDRPYDPTSLPAENSVVSALTAGEGWHNWHHKYPFDYAASEFGIASQYNPSKLLIDVFAFLRLAHGRKRATHVWTLAMRKRDEQRERRRKEGSR